MNRLPLFGLLALVVPLAPVRTRCVAAEIPAEIRVLRRTLTPLVGVQTNSPTDRLEKEAPAKPSAALALAWRLVHAHPADPANGRRWVEKAAEQGDPTAQYAVGALAADADRDTDGEMLGDFETARDWWEKAARQGHLLASIRLGDLLWDGSLGTNDGAGALAAWLPVAPGRPEVERRLGLLFLCSREGGGLFEGCDPDAARKWLTASARHGDAAAGYALRHLAQWEKRAQSLQRPLSEWLPAALRDGEIRDMGWVLEPEGPGNPPADVVNDGSGLAKLSRNLGAAERHEVPDLVRKLPGSPQEVGDPQVRYQIAELMWTGAAAFPARPQQAIHWYLAAARAGSAPAMRRIGQFWEQGVNGRPDPDEARRWYRRAESLEKAAPSSPLPPKQTATPTP